MGEASLKLPEPPLGLQGPVKAWSEPISIPTYSPMQADRNPMFLERRVYQGSSGRVYPLAFIDGISKERADCTWQAIHIENEFLRVMVLPEIGGRIHVALDKTNGYDFFYRQNVIKPALVGLAGPWISGGVEFNWPQHHRPATFMPVSTCIEHGDDGSRTIWCSDYDPLSRLKGMHGVCLRPGKALIELRVRLYNGTPVTQTFLWWANVAARVHERYQSFFPPDVQYVADHAKRAMSRFPHCDNSYYGVDYAARRKHGVEAEEAPRRFVPPGEYPPDDLSWYANIPVPTSYMAVGSAQDFFGGYDHAKQAGFVHVADHHIAPGKKQWTWGNHEFGYAWERHLTDEDGPYIELMAGVYTDNQPDFSFLAPGETKSFSQYWYPIQEIGPAQAANVDAAVSLRISSGKVRAGICVTSQFPRSEVELQHRGERIAGWKGDLSPGTPFVREWAVPAALNSTGLTVVVHVGGRELIRYTPQPSPKTEAPVPATEPALPKQIASNDELYLTGLHLEQYRHATRYPEDYWREALRRDPGDSRCNHAMGRWHLRRGEFPEAESFFRRAIGSLTRRNPNPYDGEPHFHLGLVLRYQGRDEEAYDAFYKSTWNHAWQSAGYHAIAELDTKRGDWPAALEHLNLALRVNIDHLKARNLQAIVLRKLGRSEEADAVLCDVLRIDPLDCWARHLAGDAPNCDNQVRIDIALDYARAGLYADGLAVLEAGDSRATDGSVPMLWYTLGFLHARCGDSANARQCYAKGASANPSYCFPNRLEEIEILRAVMEALPRDPRAPYYLGNLFYDRRRHREAIALWERAARIDPSYSVVWRNLGIAYFNILRQPKKARQAFDRALRAAPADARVLYERDQLWKRTGESPVRRLAELEKAPDLVRSRDDLSIELAALYNRTGKHEQALAILESRPFQPWEGGESQALDQYVRACVALGRKALRRGEPHEAQRLLERALQPPESLGEVAHPLANRSDIYYLLGSALHAAGDSVAARRWYRKAAAARSDFQGMAVRTFSDMTYYTALALQALGRKAQAAHLLHHLLAYADGLLKAKPKIDYFATSLPAMLLFEDDLARRNRVSAKFLQAQARLGLGQVVQALQKLRQALALDLNHDRAADLLAEVMTRKNQKD
jgi:tetratricopeptide (TPR) repeat protein